MAMDPQRKERLSQYTTAVKGVIYNPARMQEFLPMLDTKNGAIQAVQAILSVIEQKKPIPPDVAPLLGVNTYMLLVDMAQEIVGTAPDPEVVKGVIGELLSTLQQSYGEQGETPAMEGAAPEQVQEQQAEMPQGLVGRQMGA